MYIEQDLPNFTLDVKYLCVNYSSLLQSKKHMPLTWFFSQICWRRKYKLYLMTIDEASLLPHPFSDIY